MSARANGRILEVEHQGQTHTWDSHDDICGIERGPDGTVVILTDGTRTVVDTPLEKVTAEWHKARMHGRTVTPPPQG